MSDLIQFVPHVSRMSPHVSRMSPHLHRMSPHVGHTHIPNTLGDLCGCAAHTSPTGISRYCATRDHTWNKPWVPLPSRRDAAGDERDMSLLANDSQLVNPRPSHD